MVNVYTTSPADEWCLSSRKEYADYLEEKLEVMEQEVKDIKNSKQNP